MISKLTLIENALAIGNRSGAIKHASEWCRQEPQRTLLRRYVAARQYPGTYIDMGYSLDKIEQDGQVAFDEFIEEARSRDKKRVKK